MLGLRYDKAGFTWIVVNNNRFTEKYFVSAHAGEWIY